MLRDLSDGLYVYVFCLLKDFLRASSMIIFNGVYMAEEIEIILFLWHNVYLINSIYLKIISSSYIQNKLKFI